MGTNLKFSGSSYVPTHPTNFKFGVLGNGNDDNSVGFAKLRGPRGTTVLKLPVRAYGNGKLGAPSGNSVTRYDNAVSRGPAHWGDVAWLDGAASRTSASMGYRDSARMHVGVTEPWVEAAPLARGLTPVFAEAARIHRTARVAFEEGAGVGSSVNWQFEFARPMQQRALLVWQDGVLRIGTLIAVHEEARPIRPPLRADWQLGTPSRARTMYPFRPSGTRRITTRRGPWREGRVPKPGQSVLFPPAPTPAPSPAPCYTPPNGDNVALRFVDFWDDLRNIRFSCRKAAAPAPGTVVVPVKRVYIVVNDTSLRRVDGNIQLPTYTMGASLDFQSWTWSFSASLPASELANLLPSAEGVPVEVEANINGTLYRFLIEKRRRSRTFGKASITVQGRGKAALLDAPYAPTLEFMQPTARTHQQLFDDVLTFNGASLGWDVNYGLESWLVPGDVFAHQGSYIDAINRLAEAGGGYVQPHRTAQTLNVLPLYPAAPWDWHLLSPDFVLPADVTTQEDIEWLSQPAYNRVFVSGTNAGVLGQVTRAGTAGDRVAAMIADALCTTASAARQRGLPVLANTGASADVTLRLPVLAETGVIEPGAMVDYDDGGITRRGIVRATSLDVNMPEVWQTLKVETR